MTEDYCIRLLKELATSTKTEIGPMMVRIYMRELEKIGWARASKALEECFLDLRRFPTCNEILEKSGIKKPDDEDDANLIAGNIIQCISDCGGYKVEQARERLGELGWAVVEKFGGWDNLCMTETENLGTVRAQLRDLARSVRSHASIGTLNSSFDLPKLEHNISDMRKDVLKLVDGMGLKFD